MVADPPDVPADEPPPGCRGHGLVDALAAFPEEHPTPQRVQGLFIGFLGVLVVLGVWQGLESGEWIGIAARLAAVACYGVASPTHGGT